METEHKTIEDEYGSTILQVRASVAKPCGKDLNDDANNFKVWGILICYNLDGENKIKRLDITYDLKKEGVFTTYLSYSRNQKVGSVQVHYFDASKDPASYPEKSCDFFN